MIGRQKKRAGLFYYGVSHHVGSGLNFNRLLKKSFTALPSAGEGMGEGEFMALKKIRKPLPIEAMLTLTSVLSRQGRGGYF